MANFVIFRFLKKTKLSPCLLDMTEKKGMAGPGLDVVILSKASIGRTCLLVLPASDFATSGGGRGGRLATSFLQLERLRLLQTNIAAEKKMR